MADFYREPPPREDGEFDFEYRPDGPRVDTRMLCRAYADDDDGFYIVGIWTGQAFLDGDELKGSAWYARLEKAALAALENDQQEARDDAAIARYEQREAA